MGDSIGPVLDGERNKLPTLFHFSAKFLPAIVK